MSILFYESSVADGVTKTLRMGITNQVNGDPVDVPVEEVCSSNHSRVRHVLDEYGNYHRRDDLVGFASVKSCNLPLVLKLNAAVTCSSDPLAVLEAMLGLCGFDDNGDFFIAKQHIDELFRRYPVPDLVWLGIINSHTNNRDLTLPGHYFDYDVAEHAEPFGSDTTFAYAPADVDMSEVALLRNAESQFWSLSVDSRP